MMTRTAIAAVITALALAGCGGSAAGSGASAAAPTVAQVAARIGATDVAAIDPTLYATHEGNAAWHGQRVNIATFSTGALRGKWEAIARQFGPILADGPGYAVTTG